MLDEFYFNTCQNKINNQSLFVFAEIKTGYSGYGEGI